MLHNILRSQCLTEKTPSTTQECPLLVIIFLVEITNEVEELVGGCGGGCEYRLLCLGTNNYKMAHHSMKYSTCLKTVAGSGAPMIGGYRIKNEFI